MKLMEQRCTAGDFGRQVAEIQVRLAVLDRYTALGILVTEAEGQVNTSLSAFPRSVRQCQKYCSGAAGLLDLLVYKIVFYIRIPRRLPA